jgi:hypothetical protein
MHFGIGITSLAGVVTAAILSMAATPGLACGYEDPQSIAIGALNLAFPDSLHLRTAIWQAQVDGLLPRDPEITTASVRVAALKPRSFSATMPLNTGSIERATDPVQSIALMDALRVIEQMRLRLAAAEIHNDQPPISMVYASKVLWTRFAVTPQGVLAQPHARGPEPDDVVLITEPAVIQAMVSGTLKPEDAAQRKLVRLYGTETGTALVQRWLLALAPPSTNLITKE